MVDDAPAEDDDGVNIIGKTVRKWRERTELTLEQFGQLFDPEKSKTQVHAIESGRYKNRIDTVMDVITAIEKHYGQSFGKTWNARLATFFRGPRQGRRR